MPHILEGLITRDDIANIDVTERLKLMINTCVLSSQCVYDQAGVKHFDSGKTTNPLAKKWQLQHQGICVLSHTHVGQR